MQDVHDDEVRIQLYQSLNLQVGSHRNPTLIYKEKHEKKKDERKEEQTDKSWWNYERIQDHDESTMLHHVQVYKHPN